ncbi:DUF6456 domain-containing protein [Paracoccus luteus]|uniref:DUF6456 domain-containing protein n=1 Tax=Paracoccus luteus TaxID=2508543 RepID=UPI00107047BF|nr:DUF6456 domain-containing protein [Paracoccus luteus]
MTILTGDFSDAAAIVPAGGGQHPIPGAAGILQELVELKTAPQGVLGGGIQPCPAPAAAPLPAAGLPDDARLYLRHVEGGETIRALARETGCHASTILRRIRRFEARRDDPLVDRAVDRAGRADGAPSAISLHDQDQLRRILRRLAEPGAVLAVAVGMDKAIVTRSDIRTAVLDRRLAELIALRGWVALVGQGRITRHAITPAGRAALKGMVAGRAFFVPQAADFMDARPVDGLHAPAGPGMAEAAAPFAPAPDIGPAEAQRHRILGDRVLDDPEGGGPRRMRVNIAESPLQVLGRRRDANGQPFLDAGQVGAGERLREDFELAQMGARVAQNWDRFMTAGIDVSRHDAGGGGSEGARRRVAAALRELGPGMGDLVLRVCCFLEGIELTERRLGWSARSGKVVLRLALMRLERHYGETYGSGRPLIG